MMRKIERENTGLLHPGQDLVVAGYAGLAGTLKLVETKKEETLEIRFEDPNPPGRLEQLLRKLLRGEEL